MFTLDIPEELQSPSHIEPSMDPEGTTSQDLVDPSAPEICRAIKTQSAGPRGHSAKYPTVWFNSHLSELDTQLAALQNIADYLEMDFSNSRMVHKHVVFVFFLFVNDTQVYKLALKVD